MNWKKIDKFFATDSKYLFGNGAWIMLSQGIVMLLSLVSAYAFANLISIEEYGTYKYILSIFAICGLFTLVGMDTSVVEGVAKNEKGVYINALKARIKFGSFGAILALTIGVYYLYMGNQPLGYIFTVASLSVPFFMSLTLWKAALNGKRDFKSISIYGTIVQIGIIAITVSSLYLFKNIYYTLVMMLITHVVLHLVFHYVVIRKYKDFSSQGESNRTLQFGKRLSLLNFFTSLANNLDNIILWHFLGPVATAQYAFAFSIQAMIQKFLKSVTSLAYPKFVDKPTELLKKTLPVKIFRSMIIITPIVIAYILLLPTGFEILFPQYIESVIYAQVLSLLLIFSPLKLYGVGLVSRKQKKPVYVVNFINPIVKLVTMLLLIQSFGIWGVIASIYVTRLFSSSITLMMFKKAN